jgi:hypothetical protein
MIILGEEECILKFQTRTIASRYTACFSTADLSEVSPYSSSDIAIYRKAMVFPFFVCFSIYSLCFPLTACYIIKVFLSFPFTSDFFFARFVVALNDAFPSS